MRREPATPLHVGRRTLSRQRRWVSSVMRVLSGQGGEGFGDAGQLGLPDGGSVRNLDEAGHGGGRTGIKARVEQCLNRAARAVSWVRAAGSMSDRVKTPGPCQSVCPR
jgi:hypothetical protein